MPTTETSIPDFEKIAATIIEVGDGTVIAGTLRTIWNARGAADIEAVDKLPADPQASARGFGHLVTLYDLHRALSDLNR